MLFIAWIDLTENCCLFLVFVNIDLSYRLNTAIYYEYDIIYVDRNPKTRKWDTRIIWKT